MGPQGVRYSACGAQGGGSVVGGEGQYVGVREGWREEEVQGEGGGGCRVLLTLGVAGCMVFGLHLGDCSLKYHLKHSRLLGFCGSIP